MRSHTIMVLNRDASSRQLFSPYLQLQCSCMPSQTRLLVCLSALIRSNGSLFNLARLRSQSKCMTTLLHEFQYADDCALIADSEEALQDYIDSFVDAASSFGLTINSKKTEVMALQNSAVRNPLSVNGTHLANVHSFKYLGSTVTDDCRMDKELDCRIQCATTSFGRLWDRLWSSHDISNKTKISVYKAAITSALLFGAETWTLYQRHFVRLRRVQQRHLRAILRTCPIHQQNHQ